MTVSESQKQALQGVRILDFSWVVAGPMATSLLSGLGAEVIRVEWPLRADNMRRSLFAPGCEPSLDGGVMFAQVNVGKLGFSIDSRNPAGCKVLEKIIRKVDIVTESFSAGVLEKWGLSYARMKELNPKIIYMSLSGFGHSGRYSDYVSYGPTAQSFNGMTHMSGLPGEKPAGWGFSVMDVTAGWHAAVAALAALHHRATSGEGQYIDVSQCETGLSSLGAAMLDCSVNGKSSGRIGVPPGNRAVWPGATQAEGLRGEIGAPYNCYPTKGGGRFDYCAITVLDEDQWLAFTKAMGSPAWAGEGQYVEARLRIINQESLDARIAEWTAGFDKHELMTLLQAAGVPAGALMAPSELVESDPQLAHRNMHVKAEHPVLGERRWENFAFKLSDTPPVFKPHWPLLGADNDHVLREIAQLSDSEIAELEAGNVTWPAGTPRKIMVEGALW